VAVFDFSLIQDDLLLVEERLRGVARVDSPMLAGILRQLLQSGGKRLRPALVLLAARFHEYEIGKTTAVASAVETLHTATLVHDDLIDNSLLRRGSPTLNSSFSSGVVVLVGDYLFGMSAQLAAESRNVDLGEIFAQTVAVICSGELNSMLDGKKWTLPREEYYGKIYAKTASLFATSCEAGAIVSDATDEERRLLREFGRNLGLAFQIADDILDFVGSVRTLGKPVGSDLRQGTVTLPAICYIDRNPDQPVVRRLAGGDTCDDCISTLVDLIRSSDAIDESYAIARSFAEQAKQTLATLPNLPNRKVMLDLADFVVERKI
jgi:geranylgeranyl pyrophosphate synthase